MRSIGDQVLQRRGFRKYADALVSESIFDASKTYDTFISHSFKDAGVILGVAETLKRKGQTVYVDWIEDKGLDRTNVTKETADILRRRMRASSSLLYVSSPNASISRWMPWELGYFDGYRPNAVSIFPVVQSSDTEWKGQEYLGLYPVVEKLTRHSVADAFVVRDNQHVLPLGELRNRTLGTLTKSYDRVIGI